MPTRQKIEVGDRAPDVSMSTNNGEQVSLGDYRGRNPVVLFFYPKDGTPICTKEACSFRDAYQDFIDAGAVVIGISSDSVESHQAFAEKHELPFLLATDRSGELRRAFGVPSTMRIFPGRVTYVIDREGIVRHIVNSQLALDRHVGEVLDVVREL